MRPPKAPIGNPNYEMTPDVRQVIRQFGNVLLRLPLGRDLASEIPALIRATPSNTFDFNTRDVSVTSAIEILPANPKRKYLLIQNKSASVNAYISFGTIMTGISNGALLLIPQGNFEANNTIPASSVYASASTAVTLCVVEAIGIWD